MTKSTIVTMQFEWRTYFLYFLRFLLTVKVIYTAHPISNSKKLALLVSFSIPKHYFNFWWVFRVDLFNDLNFIISKRRSENKHFSIKCLEVQQRYFSVFISYLYTLKWGLKFTAEPKYWSFKVCFIYNFRGKFHLFQQTLFANDT